MAAAEDDNQLAGLGSERARRIISLYCRVTLPDAQSLVVDTLLFAFGEGGASIQDLVGVLGLAEKTVQLCLDHLPKPIIHRRARADGSSGEDNDSDAGIVEAADDAPPMATSVVVINYASALPFIYAHWRRLLSVAIANNLRSDEVKRCARASSSLTESIKLRPHEMFKVLHCRHCDLVFPLSEVYGLSLCPECRADIVVDRMHDAKVAITKGKKLEVEDRVHNPFLRDRKLLRQSLAMEHLFSSSFVLVDKGIVSDAQSVLVLEEFRMRSQGKSAASLLFRYRKSMRVRLVSAGQQDRDRVALNERRIAARALYPPWFEAARLLTSANLDEDLPEDTSRRAKRRRLENQKATVDEMVQAASDTVELYFAEFSEP